MKDETIFRNLSELAVAAGDEIMQIYSGNFDIEFKEDESPLTAADKASHNIIAEGLAGFEFRGRTCPVISEEGVLPDYEDRKDWDYYWLIDPLDGTKEFINRRDEFTVNIALIKKDQPYLGLVYLPVTRTLYFGGPEHGSFKLSADCSFSGFDACAERLPLSAAAAAVAEPDVLRAAGSRSHRSAEFDGWVQAEAARRGCSRVEIVTAGSSLKFCLAAEGLIDVYPRFGPTMEWDTAAAHAVVLGAGKKCTRLDGSTMLYNKPDMRNEGFLVM